ncbi:MAG: hypothetical protein IJ705_06730, partial [Oscillospiraceae bacterium]|nr:hypothetical protein [Oscillospiraceae bacterium]
MDAESRRRAEPERGEGQASPSPAEETAALDMLFALLPRLPDPQTLSGAQKDRERKLYRERLKALNTVPRSDWHREFENILQIEMESWHNGAVMDREVSIGEDAPRADFIVVSETALPREAKSVFRFFRRKNAIEYKRPSEAVTERMIWKTAGYGALLIGADPAAAYDPRELTLSVFAYRKNEKQFDAMLKDGLLQKGDAGGVYRVTGMTPLPYQIVIARELEGREYAAFRALSDHSDVRDVSALLEAMKVCSLQSRDRYFSILQTIEAHNPGTVSDMIQEDRAMKDIFLDLFEPQIQERERIAAEGAAEKTAATIYTTVVERMINEGVSGHVIANTTGYD